jgi:hypothetical protein
MCPVLFRLNAPFFFKRSALSADDRPRDGERDKWGEPGGEHGAWLSATVFGEPQVTFSIVVWFAASGPESGLTGVAIKRSPGKIGRCALQYSLEYGFGFRAG